MRAGSGELGPGLWRPRPLARGCRPRSGAYSIPRPQRAVQPAAPARGVHRRARYDPHRHGSVLPPLRRTPGQLRRQGPALPHVVEDQPACPTCRRRRREPSPRHDPARPKRDGRLQRCSVPGIRADEGSAHLPRLSRSDLLQQSRGRATQRRSRLRHHAGTARSRGRFSTGQDRPHLDRARQARLHRQAHEHVAGSPRRSIWS